MALQGTLTTWKWQVTAGLMRSVGTWSKGIALGYARGFDSGEMLDYVYANQPQGRFGVGALIDAAYLRAIGWRAIRARKALLQAVLREEILAGLQSQSLVLSGSQDQSGSVVLEDEPLTVLDVAGGPGRYLLELAREWQPAPGAPARVQFVCRDRDLRGLAVGRARAAAWGVPNIRYEPGDAFDPAALATVTPRPGVVVVSGLYELLLAPSAIGRSIGQLYDLLPPGGRLVFTTQVRHPQLDFIANVLVNRDGDPWVMICRPLAEVEAWARAAGFVDVSSQLEPHGLFGVTVCRK